jgi:hypothetical protein
MRRSCAIVPHPPDHGPREDAQGMHFFRRSLRANAYSYHDGGAEDDGVDFKTVCSSRTSRFVVVAPSLTRNGSSRPGAVAERSRTTSGRGRARGISSRHQSG